MDDDRLLNICMAVVGTAAIVVVILDIIIWRP